MAAQYLPTAVVGSYSMPAWLERAKNDFLRRRITAHDLDEMHDAAVKAAIKDQEVAGLDVVSDGELRRDNMIDYFATRLPGVEIDRGSKASYYDFYESVVRNRMPMAPLGLVEHFRFLRRFTERRTKVSVTGPHSLVKRIRNQFYPTEEVFAVEIARIMNLELRELVRAGAEQIREALAILPVDRLSVNPDCGLLHLPREVAFPKLGAMVEGAQLVRRELQG